MPEDEIAGWEKRYAEGRYNARPVPSAHLVEWIDLVPKGRALDIACGTGRNAIFLAQHGFDVVAVDGAQTALDLGREQAEAQGLSIQWVQANLDDYEPEQGAYTVVTSSFYLNRDLLPKLEAALAPDGWMFFEQHLRTRHLTGGHQGWRLEPNELLTTYASLRVLSYAERYASGEAEGRSEMYATVRFVGCKGDPGF